VNLHRCFNESLFRRAIGLFRPPIVSRFDIESRGRILSFASILQSGLVGASGIDFPLYAFVDSDQLENQQNQWQRGEN
jgi:hypothetical protein